MTVFNILNPNCNIFGKKILEASAGTGKTFAIEHIIIRLLIEKNSLIAIDQILVVTFTKKATNELKYRIRNNLEKALRFLNQKENYDIFDYLKSYINDKEAIFKIQNAIDLFESAQIFTIHSFCFKNLKEFSLDANLLIDNEEEKQNNQLIKKLVNEYLKFNIHPDDYSYEQIEILFNSHRDAELLVNNIAKDIDQNLEKKDFKNFVKLYEEFLKEIKCIENLNIDDILIIFNEIEKNFKKDQKFKNDNFIEQLKILIFLINNKNHSALDFRKLLKTKCTVFEFLSEKNKKVIKKNFELPRFFKSLKQNIYPIIQEAVDSRKLYERLLIDISLWINNYLENNDILTFDGILLRTKNALNSLSFKNKIQNKYKAVIIDEFQDTDRIQFEIFDELFFSNNNVLAIYLIGDPKQSIYSFRKADLYTYLKASSKITETNYLDTNFRSSKSLINSLNALFDESFAKKWLILPQLSKSLNYIPVKSGIKNDFIFNDNLAPLHFFIAEDNFKNQRWPTEKIEQKYFSFITNEIIKLKKQNGFTDNNFAVLVNDRYQAQRLKYYFNKFSISSFTSRSTSLKNSIALNAMKEFLEAVIFPYDWNKVKIALMGPYIQIPDEIIKNLDFEKDIVYLEKFYYLRSILNKGIHLFFSSFFYSTWLEKSVLEKITSFDDSKFYNETISLIELILSQKKLTFNQILNFLKNLNDLDDDDDQIKIDQLSDKGVQILTTFMSKGLEYDVVFALSLASRNVDKFNDNLNEIDAEKMRQFYVALTRAKYRVYLPIALDLNEKEIKTGSFSCIEYFFTHVLETKNFINKDKLLEKLKELNDKKLISYSFIDTLNNASNCLKNDDVILNPSQKFNRKFKVSYIYSFSSLNRNESEKYEDKKQIDNIPAGIETGILFHEIFEKILRRAKYEETIVRTIIKESISDTELFNYEANIFDIIKKVFEYPLLKENRLSLKEISFENLKTEVEFLFSNNNDYIKGFIDLVFSFEDKYYIIDWKTNYLGSSINEYSFENIDLEMKKHNYYLQAAIYSEGLRRYLNILKKDFSNHFGGAYYIFLRGLTFGKEGVFHFYPNLDLLNKIDRKELNKYDWGYEKF